jgi:hypothetical protein
MEDEAFLHPWYIELFADPLSFTAALIFVLGAVTVLTLLVIVTNHFVRRCRRG